MKQSCHRVEVIAQIARIGGFEGGCGLKSTPTCVIDGFCRSLRGCGEQSQNAKHDSNRTGLYFDAQRPENRRLANIQQD